MTTPAPALHLVQPALRDFAHPARSFVPLTPYLAGFEDCAYSRVYANPYEAGTDAWRKYDAGHADARCRRRTTPGAAL